MLFSDETIELVSDLASIGHSETAQYPSTADKAARDAYASGSDLVRNNVPPLKSGPVPTLLRYQVEEYAVHVVSDGNVRKMNDQFILSRSPETSASTKAR